MILSVNSDSQFLTTANYVRKSLQARNQTMEKLETGSRINRGADDPGFLAVGTNMTSQTRGVSVAIENIQDGINLIRTADSGVSEMQDMYLRIHELSVRGANEATLNSVKGAADSDPMSDVRSIFKEILNLEAEVYKMSSAHTFNGKLVLSEFGDNPNGKSVQAGPDSQSSNVIGINIPSLSNYGIPYYVTPQGDYDQSDYTDAFQNNIKVSADRLNELSDVRSYLGTQENRLTHALSDLTDQYVNVSASKSQIMDADISEEFVNLTKSSIVGNMGESMMAHSTIDPSSVYQLMESAGLGVALRMRIGA